MKIKDDRTIGIYKTKQGRKVKLREVNPNQWGSIGSRPWVEYNGQIVRWDDVKGMDVNHAGMMDWFKAIADGRVDACLHDSIKDESLNSKIKAWFLKAHPEEEYFGKQLNANATFQGLYETIKNKQNVYNYIGSQDSVVREYIFQELADILHQNYQTIYRMWLGDSMKKYKIGNKIITADSPTKALEIHKMLTKDASYSGSTIRVNSPDDINQMMIVNAIRDTVKNFNRKVKEIDRGKVFETSSGAGLVLQFYENDYGTWTWSDIKLYFEPTYEAQKEMHESGKDYARKKFKADIKQKLKQYENKTLYLNNSITSDSISDEDGVENNLSSRKLRTPRGEFNVYNGSYIRKFRFEPDADDWGLWFDHMDDDGVLWKIMHNAKTQHAVAVRVRDSISDNDSDVYARIDVKKFIELSKKYEPHDPVTFEDLCHPHPGFKYADKWEDIDNKRFRSKSEYDDYIRKGIDAEKKAQWLLKQGVRRLDSISDEDVDQLSEEERQAIDDYKKAISATSDPKLLNLFSHILREEIEHLEELQNAKEGEFEDSYKDSPLSFKSNINMSALKSNITNLMSSKNPIQGELLKANLDGISADILEWKDLKNKGEFDDDESLKKICKKIAKDYLDLLNNGKLAGVVKTIDANLYNYLNKIVKDLYNFVSMN